MTDILQLILLQSDIVGYFTMKSTCDVLDSDAVRNCAAGSSEDQATEHPSDPPGLSSNQECGNDQSRMPLSSSAVNSSDFLPDARNRTFLNNLPAIQNHASQTINANANTFNLNIYNNVICNDDCHRTTSECSENTEYEIHEVNNVPR